MAAGYKSPEVVRDTQKDEAVYLRGNVGVGPDLILRFRGTARQHADAKQHRFGRDRGASGGEHRPAPGEVNGQHLDPEPRRRPDRAGDGGRDIVKFQIEKNPRLTLDLRFRDNVRPAGGEKLEPELEKADPAAESANQFQCGRLVRHVDGGDNSIFRRSGSCHSLAGMKRVARAKINLSLRIRGKRADGFHELESLFAPLVLADVLTFEDAPAFAFTCDDPTLPVDDSNLAVRAARRFSERDGRPLQVHIHLEKHIPHGAGLGGGSSDAATVLRALNDRSGNPLTPAVLREIADELGSDVPFFLQDSAALCRGRGEIVEPRPLVKSFAVLLIKPPFPVPTPWAYQRWSASRELSGVSYAAQHADGVELINDLERPVFEKYLFLAALKTWLTQQPEVAAALMSGSGSTTFALVRDAGSMTDLERRTRAEFGNDLWCCQTETVG